MLLSASYKKITGAHCYGMTELINNETQEELE
jgi:hypothetical protein